MLAWKLLVPAAAVLIGGGITAAAVQKGGFACVAPWYKDTSCGIPQVSIPPKGNLTIIIGAVTKDGKKHLKGCPTLTIFDANNNKQVGDVCDFACDNALCGYNNPSKEANQMVYVRFSTRELENVDVRGSWWVYE